jgi:apolipoprotein N-acyltransferase
MTLSGVAMGSAFPPASLRPLAWIGMVPLLLALRGASLGAALALTWGFTLIGAWVVGSWLPASVAHYFLQPLALGYAFFLGTATGMAALYYMGWAAVHRACAGRLDPRWLPLASAAAWTAAELGRARLLGVLGLFVGNPWGLLGYSQADIPALVQVASVTGIYGTSFAIVACNVALAEALQGGRAGGAARRRRLAGLAIGLAPALLVVTTGATSLRGAPAPTPGPAAVPVAAVQGNVDVGTRWRSDLYGQNLDVYLRETVAALRAQPGSIVVWPEAALTFFLEDEPLYAAAIGRVLAAGGGELLVGGPRREGAEGDGARYYNSVFAVDAHGALRARYDKQHLVPFSEYFPLRRIDLLRRNFERVRSFAHGAPGPPLPTRAGGAGVLLCNESMLPEDAGARVREGATWLVVPSNDGWIPSRRFADHLFDIVRLRAIEQRRWLVRASTSGPSAIVDPWGRVQGHSPPFERTHLTGWIEPRHERTPYARFGDAFAALCVASVPISLWRARRRRAAPRPW